MGSFVPSDGVIGAGVDIDYNAAIDSELTHLPTKIPYSLLDEIKQYQNQQRSYLTQIPMKMPLSLLVEIKQQRQDSEEILNIVCYMLQVAAADEDKCQQRGNNKCNFLSPMIKKTMSLKVDASKLSMLSLDDDSDDEIQDEEEQKVDDVDSTVEESQVGPKRVNFEPLTTIEYMISRQDITDDEKRKYWLQDEEFALIRLRDGYLGNLAEQKIREMAAAAKADSSETYLPPSSIALSPQHWICTRGLEFKMKLGFLKTQDRRLACLESVLIEQERQWDEHWDNSQNNSPFDYDDESIANSCREISNECKTHAERVAENDRREVEEFLQAEESDE